MEVKIVFFPETKVAAVEHLGAPGFEHNTVRKLVAWKLDNRLLDQSQYRSYGIHYTDPRITPPSDHRVDFCLSYDKDVGINPYGIRNSAIPKLRCACARDVGSRANNRAAAYLNETWRPQSGESLGDFPIFFTTSTSAPMFQKQK